MRNLVLLVLLGFLTGCGQRSVLPEAQGLAALVPSPTATRSTDSAAPVAETGMTESSAPATASIASILAAGPVPQSLAGKYFALLLLEHSARLMEETARDLQANGGTLAQTNADENVTVYLKTAGSILKEPDDTLEELQPLWDQARRGYAQLANLAAKWRSQELAPAILLGELASIHPEITRTLDLVDEIIVDEFEIVPDDWKQGREEILDSMRKKSR